MMLTFGEASASPKGLAMPGWPPEKGLPVALPRPNGLPSPAPAGGLPCPKSMWSWPGRSAAAAVKLDLARSGASAS